MSTAQSPVQALEESLACEWIAIRKARETTAAKRATLQEVFRGKLLRDTSVVLFGSIAREEMTSGSDADWILLADGQAFPEHEIQKSKVERLLEGNGFGEPGSSGVFGCLVGSHSLVHEIGGEDDTNSNTTRRMLLLLESFAVGDHEPYARVRRQVLNRYLRDDRGLLSCSGKYRVPRFLLNDLTRYWRTITVDFVYKQRKSAGKKWALRNAKLRLSRKLVFTSGLLRCFFCHLDQNAASGREDLVSKHDPTRLISYMESELSATPLELLARAAARPDVSHATARALFDNYDGFLALLDNEEYRSELSNLLPDQVGTSKVWGHVRELDKGFQSGLTSLFYGEDKELNALIVEYSVF